MTDNIIEFRANYSQETSLSEMLDAAKEKWGDDVNLDKIAVYHESIKESGCNCCHDPSDYVDYIFLRLDK